MPKSGAFCGTNAATFALASLFCSLEFGMRFSRILYKTAFSESEFGTDEQSSSKVHSTETLSLATLSASSNVLGFCISTSCLMSSLSP